MITILTEMNEIEADRFRKIGYDIGLRKLTLLSHVAVDRFKRRTVVLHPTLLSYAKSSSVEDMISSNRSIDQKRDFPLAPLGLTEITQVGDTLLTLALYQTMAKNPKTLQICGLDTKVLFKQITLKFDSRATRDDWMKMIISECNEVYVKSLFADNSMYTSTFIRLVHEELWGRILLGTEYDDIRRAFVFSSKPAQLKILRNTVYRIVLWIRKLSHFEKALDERFCGLFVEFFVPAMRSYVFRALLFVIDPDESFLADYLQAYPLLPEEIKRTSGDNLQKTIVAAEHFVWQWGERVLNAPWEMTNYFLLVLHHPLAERRAGEAEASRSTFFGLNLLGDTAVEKSAEVYFPAEELSWQTESGADTFSWEMLQCSFNEPPFLAFHFIMKEIRHVIDDSCMSKVVQYLSDMPIEFFAMSFTAFSTAKKSGAHFQTLAQYCKYRELWRPFAEGLHHSGMSMATKAFADSVHKHLWTVINTARQRNGAVAKMFLPTAADVCGLNVRHCVFSRALSGDILRRLGRCEPGVSAVFSLKTGGTDKLVPVELTREDEEEVHIQLDALRQLCRRIISWIHAMTRRTSLQASDANIFVQIFSVAVNNTAFRAILWLFDPSPGILDEYLAEQEEGSMKNIDESPLQMVEKALAIYGNIRQNQYAEFTAFLRVVDHPVCKMTADINAECTWSVELRWMRNIGAKSEGNQWLLTWQEMQLAFAGTSWLTFCVLLRHFDRNDMTPVLQKLSKLPLHVVLSSFSCAFTLDNLENLTISSSSPLEYGAHFLSFANACRVQLVWHLFQTGTMTGESERQQIVKLRYWKALERSREGASLMQGLRRISSPLSAEDRTVGFSAFASVIPTIIRSKLNCKEEPWIFVYDFLHP